MSEPHPVSSDPDVPEHVGFLLAREVAGLPKPWPRCQDLPLRVFGVPLKDDLVLAVSHAWPYGAHPDPMADKQSPMALLIEEACSMHKPQGKTVIFCDFLSVSQRPFAAGQAERTPAQEAAFAKALRAFPHIYLQADAVLHIDLPTQQVPDDGQLYYVSLDDLEGAKLRQLGSALHVIGWNDAGNGAVAPFDVVTRVGNNAIKTMEDLERARKASATPPAGAWTWPRCCTRSRPAAVVQMRRLQYGHWNSLSADQKGWVYLERFASMVKAAMVHEDQAQHVAFATSDKLLREIMDGGKILRSAAGGGKETLNDALQHFVKELEAKHFSAVSVDKATNTGGVGGVKSGDAPSGSSDRDVVVRLMHELVGHLAADWDREEKAQRQRQLILAVSRGDSLACRQLIESGADPNMPDSHGLTCLHSGARYRDAAVVELLIACRGDLFARDTQGNCPAHHLRLYAEDSTVPLFQLLAPCQEVLDLPNSAGVRPLQRFAAWAATAVHSKPYLPAESLVKELQQRYPELQLARAPPTLMRLMSTSSLKQAPVTERVEELSVLGRSVQVSVWEPVSGGVQTHILYLGMAVYLPWSMQKIAVKQLAEYVCMRFGARLIACHEGSVAPEEVMYKPLDAFHAYLKALIDALPLPAEFFLVDNAMGCGTALLWQFRERISGALVLNPLGWFSEDFYGSEAHDKIFAVVRGHAGLCKARDIEGLCKLVGNFLFAESAADVEAAMETYRAALADAPPEFWDFQASLPEWLIGSLTPCYRALGPLGSRMPVMLTCGSHSPVLLVQETAGRLKGLMANAKIAYISDSKQWWEAEGHSQASRVGDLLVNMLRQPGDLSWVEPH